MKPDRERLRALQPGEKITAGGIEAERMRDGDLRYLANIMVDGERIHRVLGYERRDYMTWARAAGAMERLRTEKRAGRLQLPPGRKIALGLDTAAPLYIALMEESGGKNVKAKRRHLRMHLVPFFKDQPLDALSTFAIERYKKQRLATGAAVSTTNRELTTLRHLLGVACEKKWLAALPCRIRQLPGEKTRIVALDNAEVDALMAAAIADSDPDLWLFIAIALGTSLRHREVLRARFDQVNFTTLRLAVPVSKTGAREQPITRSLADILQRERDMRDDPDGWIFPAWSNGRSPHRLRMANAFRRAVVAAGLDPVKITPHALRHTAITNLVQAGADIPTIMKVSGHRTVGMVLRYTHVHDPHVDKAMAALERPQDYTRITHSPADDPLVPLKIVK